MKRKIEIGDTNYQIEFNPKGINAISIKVNDNETDKILWTPYRVDVSQVLMQGENTIKLTISNNLRNMLGPHHIQEECYAVTPGTFLKEKRVRDWEVVPSVWNDGYCLNECSL